MRTFLMKKVIVTGASGFIGRHTLSHLKLRGYEVYAVYATTPHPEHEGIHWVPFDLLKTHAIADWIGSIAPTHLLHLAWNTTPGKYWTALNNFDWVQSSLELLKAFVQHGGKRAVMAGTCAEYDWKANHFSERETPCVPRAFYGKCKHALSLLSEAFAQQSGLSLAWGRIFFLYGPHEYPQRLVPAVIRGLIQREQVPCSHGNQLRDFLHVDDAAAAFAALLDSSVQGYVNIGSGTGVALKEVIGKIASCIGNSECIQLGALQSPPNDPPSLIADTTRLKQEVLWEPKYSLDAGIEQTIRWWQEQQI